MHWPRLPTWTDNHPRTHAAAPAPTLQHIVQCRWVMSGRDCHTWRVQGFECGGVRKKWDGFCKAVGGPFRGLIGTQDCKQHEAGTGRPPRRDARNCCGCMLFASEEHYTNDTSLHQATLTPLCDHRRGQRENGTPPHGFDNTSCTNCRDSPSFPARHHTPQTECSPSSVTRGGARAVHQPWGGAVPTRVTVRACCGAREGVTPSKALGPRGGGGRGSKGTRVPAGSRRQRRMWMGGARE
jgi:hypothetical protein